MPTLRARPKVFRAGGSASVRLTLRGAGGPGPFQVRLVPVSGQSRRMVHPEGAVVGRMTGDGEVTLTCVLPMEQEYTFRLEDVSGSSPVLAAEACVYAVDDDLFHRKPWKGDFHMHSNRSDGLEEPAEVAAHCRRIGMDYMALTDHHLYAPSREAMAAFRGKPVDLLILPGEEVHPPDNSIHVLAVGGERSVNEMLDTPAYRSDLRALEKELTADLEDLPAEDRYAYLSAVWCFRQVRAAGGLAVYPHPYWHTHSRYDVPTPLTDKLLVARPFDAVELLGGYYFFQTPSNTLMILKWMEERSRGGPLPVTGSSDAHGCLTGQLFGWSYSITFAEDNSWERLLPAHREDWCVAVESRPNEAVRAWGSFRLSQYAHFLLREVLPRHDDLCLPEGEAMLRVARGDASGVADLGRRQGAVKRLYEELWAPKSEATGTR